LKNSQIFIKLKILRRVIKEIVDLIRNNSNFVITSHVNPDGDSIGCQLALLYFLKELGKNATCISYSETPVNYRFLDRNVIEKYSAQVHDKLISNADVIFILDTNEYSRVKAMASKIKESKAKKVCIDHHLGRDSAFDYLYTDESSPSTGEMLYKIITSPPAPLRGRGELSKEIAEALYTAIMTDTGSFRFPRTDSETHRIAAELIEHGADPVKIYEEVYDKSSFGRLKLLATFLNNVVQTSDGKLAYSIIRQSDFNETNTNVFDTEGFSHHLLSVGTVQIGLIFTEGRSGIKVSFRSKGDTSVNDYAKEFGGGGHQNAAGAFIEGGKMEEVVEKVLGAAEKYIS
jgi:phosphoesterase RecJ-like protein